MVLMSREGAEARATGVRRVRERYFRRFILFFVFVG